MKSKVLKVLIFLLIIIVLVIGLGRIANNSGKPGKYDKFAQCLKDSQAQFFGAFWCPHCQAQKKLFGSSAKILPYIECSNPDRSQTQECIDQKIESYPTWKFASGITLTSANKPIVCTKAPGKDGEDPICKQRASTFFDTWIFSNMIVKSPVAPTEDGDKWIFPKEAQSAVGEAPLEFLSEQTKCELPL